MSHPTPITLLPSSIAIDREALERSHHACDGQIIVCDAYVTGIERGDLVAGGYALGKVLNVDHHAPTRQMQRLVSSANLAIERVVSGGVATPGDVVLINHTDCDSILSSGIVSGRLDPEARFGAAAIAADHTGEIGRASCRERVCLYV